jgi:hypothetical protein
MLRTTAILIALAVLAGCEATMTSNASGELEQQQAAPPAGTGGEWWAN